MYHGHFQDVYEVTK